MIRISATAMQNFTSCKRKYYYYKTSSFQGSLAFEFGKAFESGLEKFVNGKTLDESLTYATDWFNRSEVKNVIYKELEKKEIAKGGDSKDVGVRSYLTGETESSVLASKRLMESMLPRLINFITNNHIKITDMQLSTTISMDNGNKNLARIDGLCEYNGKKWIFELKSYKTFKKLEDLKVNTQLLNYTNILKRKGEDIEGVLFCQVKKIIPSEPKILKNGCLSTSKTQSCTAVDYFKKATEMYGETNIPIKVLETYEYLFNKTPFIEGLEVIFTQKELDAFNILTHFISEDMDMLTSQIKNDPEVAYNKCYPNYGNGCSWCNYKSECWRGIK